MSACFLGSSFFDFSAGNLIFVNVANVACGFYGMRVIDVPLFLCFRRTSVAFALAMEFLCFGKKPLPTIAFAITLSCAGALIAGVPVMKSQGLGMLWMLGNNVFTALSLTMVSPLAVQRTATAVRLRSRTARPLYSPSH
jgi:hypothetical protein